MRIGFLLPSTYAIGSPGNGIAEQARNQAAALERRGHQVVRLNPWARHREEDLDVLHLFAGGLHFYGIEANRRLKKQSLLALSPIIDSNQSFLAYRLACMAGSLSSRFPTVPSALMNQARRCDIVVCRSSHEYQRVVRSLGISPSRAAIVLNGIDVPRPSPSDLEKTKQALQLPDEFVLHVSAYTQERKNAVRLIDAVERLGFPLIIAGSGRPGVVCEALSRAKQRSALVRILGFVDEGTRNALYSLCKVFCLPSIHEGTGLAALEAGSLGANIVITKYGGPSDYFLSHAEYVNPFDTDDIARGLELAWCRPKSGELARHISNALTWDHSARSLEMIYQNVLRQRTG